MALIAWLCARDHWLEPLRDAVDVSRWINGAVTPQHIAVRLAFEWALDTTAFVAIGACTVVALSSKLARMKPLTGLGTVLLAGLVCQCKQFSIRQ
jgi:hypothetical protein